MSEVDQDLVKHIHRRTGELLHIEKERREAAQRRGERVAELSGMAEQQFARKIIADVIRGHAEQLLARGKPTLGDETEFALAEGVHARMFGAGRLQVLLNDESIENIDINGCDEVWITRAGSAHPEPFEPVASTDEELIELVQTLASYAGLNSRPWDSANPELDLQLPDGSRLSAVMGVSVRPSISIRRHRFEKVALADLVGLGSVTEEAAAFLTAIVKSRANVMIAGATDAGKTTLLRAMAGEIPAEERIITIEKALELGLRKDIDRHPNCVEFEAKVANSEGHGAVPMARLVQRTLRQNPDRVIVGEVLGPEVIDMLNAMGQGNDGSLSTIHARSARDVFNRIATYAIQSEERLPHEASYQLIAGGLDFVVFISRDPHTGDRRLDSILEVNGFEKSVLSSEIFAAPAKGHSAVWTGTVPGRIDELAAAGWVQPGAGRW
ncbi:MULTISPECIES: CpaF family protein [unclassified Nocardioides]|uniref:CpaF family protein n=1 Tax=unclassified Nocardioides TaxID=2615069 RepID=UPI0009F0AFD0|nr:MULTISPECIES: ATPase, T2SS/T4P/T4SS family [unclassified Nocardioides]GAW48036.1 Type II secretion system protein E [Nocardioides sp. PD653-B2]GAW53661.1 Type II secretion system protein E [Nocardioides sp. PD653]